MTLVCSDSVKTKKLKEKWKINKFQYFNPGEIFWLALLLKSDSTVRLCKDFQVKFNPYLVNACCLAFTQWVRCKNFRKQIFLRWVSLPLIKVCFHIPVYITKYYRITVNKLLQILTYLRNLKLKITVFVRKHDKIKLTINFITVSKAWSIQIFLVHF